MEKLKEQYDAELQALRESVEEATQVSPPLAGQPERVSGWARKCGLGTDNRAQGLPRQRQWSCFLFVRVKLSSWK